MGGVLTRASLTRRFLAVVVTVLVGVALPSTGSGAEGGLRTPSWTPYDRPATFGVVTDHDVPVTMPDGVVLRADVARPDTPGRFPVIVTQTPYNKGAYATHPFFVERGYVHAVVDVRGTGSSGGRWESFGATEQADGKTVVEWAAHQPWSDGNIGLWGPSYMGINQLFTAAQHPEGLRALFPIVAAADPYRDIVYPGGQFNAGFMPAWSGVVLAAGIPGPRLAARDPATAARLLGEHVVGDVTTMAPTLLDALTEGERAYDGPFWRTRSPIEVIDRIDVPTFLVGGENDLFQRGTPLLYEGLRRRGVPARLVIGPWNHLEGAVGAGLPAPDLPLSLDQMALRWFDQHLKGMGTGVDATPPVTQYEEGPDRWAAAPDWPTPAIRTQRLHLRSAEGLSPEPAGPGEGGSSTLQQPLSGLCTGSTAQWTAGGMRIPGCTDDLRHEGHLSPRWTTPPLTEPLHLNGPIAANLWISTTGADAAVTVRVVDVAPDGKATDLTDGWLSASFRAVDRGRSRLVGGENLQPWHPFTAASRLPVPAGAPLLLQVEVFPTDAVIEPGHRLQVMVQPSDFPHALPSLPSLARQTGGILTVLHDAEHPSYVALPVVTDQEVR
jgi:putative CocE/NonD family hydrolase